MTPRPQGSTRTARRVVAALAATGCLVVLAACGSSGDTASTGTTTTTTGSTTSTAATGSGTGAVTDVVLDPNHDYGDKYADGILPVGDGKSVTDGPKKGYVYLCQHMDTGGGAQSRGPWFVNDDTEYDINQKIHVQGQVDWNGDYSATIDGDTRVVTTNDVPGDHPTGVFPVQSDDPAYQYDRNPNKIEEQSLTYRLAASPQVLDTPGCMGGESGVMTTGVALFNAFDAGERDAGAWEVQDDCDGHPQAGDEYHYHTLSSCITDVGVGTVIGFALDGFPITGPKVGDGNVLTTDDLDECHGITSAVTLDGAEVTTYHYVMTEDFPYSVSCFRGTAVDPPHVGAGGPPGG